MTNLADGLHKCVLLCQLPNRLEQERYVTAHNFFVRPASVCKVLGIHETFHAEVLLGD